MEPHVWTPEEVTELTKLYNAYVDYDVIVEKLGLPIEVIRRKVYKLGLAAARPKAVFTELKTDGTAPHLVIPDTAKIWTERTNKECAFPVGIPSRPYMQLSCCRKTQHKYCAQHRKIMFEKSVRRR